MATVGGGLYLVSQRSERRSGGEDTIAQIAELARAEQDAKWLQQAIRNRQAILGMTQREVERAKGPPHLKQSSDALTETHRAHGGVENWIYPQASGDVANVLFGVNGLVVYSSDVGDQPGEGQVIRR